MPFRFFIPQSKYGKRSALLRYKAMVAYAFFLLSLFLSTYLIKLSVPAVLGYATNVYTQDLLTDTNEVRRNAKLAPLTVNYDLEKAAQAKAKHMFAHNYWAHTSPSGVEPWDFIIASGYDYLYAGENLAIDFNNSKSVVDAWYASPTHKANLVNDKYTDIGFAVLDGELQGRKTTLVVQMFGKPRSGVFVKSDRSATVVPKEITELINEVSDLPLGQVKPLDKTSSIKVSAEPLAGTVLNAEGFFNASRYLAITIGLFLSIIFAIDGYFVRKYGVLRVSGHAILHILILLLAVFAIWYTNIGIVL